MPRRTSAPPAPLDAWFITSLLWVAWLGMLALVMLYRGLRYAGIMQTIDFGDVPLLEFCQNQYPLLYAATVGLGAIALGSTLLCSWPKLRWLWQQTEDDETGRSWIRLLLACGPVFVVALTVALSAVACRCTWPQGAAFAMVGRITPVDMVIVALVASTLWLLPWLISAPHELPPADDRRPAGARANLPARLATIYLLGTVAVVVYALFQHQKFWDPEKNGGYKFAQFFQPAEIPQANLVFLSTSLLFASLAALAGCAAMLVLRLSTRASRRAGGITSGDCLRLALLIAALWAIALMAPWQIKIRSEIVHEDNGWIVPAATLLFTAAGLAPLLTVSLLMMKQDFDEDFLWRTQLGAEPGKAPSAGAAKLAGSVRGDPGTGGQAGSDLRSALLDKPALAPRGGFYPTPAEMGLWAVVLFPIYPLLRVYGRLMRGRAFWTLLTLASGAAIGLLLWAVVEFRKWYTFDDWRRMMRSAQFPFLQVLLSLLAAMVAYVVFLRLLNLGRFLVAFLRSSRAQRAAADGANTALVASLSKPGSLLWIGRAGVIVAALALFGMASWPFWGWSQVSRNVQTRCVEFNSRHEFELLFLHWAFDFDRDGYAAVLHGADPDDFDASITPGGIAAPDPSGYPVPIDEFVVADLEKAETFPNVIILYLEGVTPRSISAYGQRKLPKGLIATPNMDSVAADGTLFTNARCFYPSTWDAWFAVNSGRFLRVAEMDTSQPFGDRYTRYNNLYKVLELAGVDRWCHADCAPYFDLSTPQDMRTDPQKSWKTHDRDKYTSWVTGEESERGLWRGDKRNKRMLEFLDDLKPGERFFMCEHMSDTHFDWERTSLERARELGFPNGLKIYEADAVLSTGQRDDTYARYLQTITRMDGQVGQILDKLKAKGLYDNTLIVIVSDHGCQWWEHEHMYYVGHLYEQSLHVPMMIKAPGFPAGQVANAPVMQFDILPTVMEIAGIKQVHPRADYPLPGRSLTPLMRGQKSAELDARYRQRDLILTTHYDTLGVITHFRHKLVFDRPSGTYWLFDLEKDPGETVNLVDSEPELLQRMIARLRELAAQNPAMIGRIEASESMKAGQP